MPYEALSRALAYTSCLSTVTLFATSMAIVAINFGKMRLPPACEGPACVMQTANAPPQSIDGTHIEAVATALWQKKI